MSSGKQVSSWSCPDWPSRVIATMGLLTVTAYVFGNLLQNCVSRWIVEPQYSHGFVIPLMAVGLGWMRRTKIASGTARCHAGGLALLMTGLISHLTATWLYVEALDSFGFLCSLTGTILLVWGRRFFRGVWPAVLFTGFMLPLPFQLERMLSDPLQILGASESAWFIQAFGIPAISQGNTIVMGDTRLGVAEACSGLRMLMVFIAISAAAVIVSERTLWEKLLVLLSAIPIALISNIMRIVATAVAHQSMGRATADLVFHDLSGWLMMPLAITLLFIELKILDALFVEVADSRPGLTWHKISDPIS
jgi:exosortase